MLEESQCQLKFYNSEAEARKKPPIDQIELKGAAISLDLEQQNQFIIMWVKQAAHALIYFTRNDDLVLPKNIFSVSFFPLIF